MIDDASLQYYKNVTGAYGDVLRSRIDFTEECFYQDSCKRCAFLNENNLCDMYEHLGEESLCATCTNYPRHIEEFENIREITLSLSCPEVAHILLTKTEPVTFFSEEKDEPEETFEDYDPFFFSYLEDARDVLLHILQNRSIHIWVRYMLVLQFVQEMQDTIEHYELFDLADLFDKYEDKAYLSQTVSNMEQQMKAYDADSEAAFSYGKSIFSFLYELEFLSDDWPEHLDSCWNTLYQNGADAYQKLHADFRRYCEEKPGHGFSTECFCKNGFSMDIILEQLLVYFIFTYFCGAVYDDNVIGKVNLSLNSVFYLYEMFLAHWTDHDQKITLQDIEKIAYRYSRELEHSDLNLEKMEG